MSNWDDEILIILSQVGNSIAASLFLSEGLEIPEEEEESSVIY